MLVLASDPSGFIPILFMPAYIIIGAAVLIINLSTERAAWFGVTLVLSILAVFVGLFTIPEAFETKNHMQGFGVLIVAWLIFVLGNCVFHYIRLDRNAKVKRRRANNYCTACGYDLRGSSRDKFRDSSLGSCEPCPECGHASQPVTLEQTHE